MWAGELSVLGGAMKVLFSIFGGKNSGIIVNGEGIKNMFVREWQSM